MTVESVQYRSVIRYLVLRGKTREDIYFELHAAYGEEAPSQATIKRWFNEFKSGRVSVQDEDKPGRPCEIGDKIKEKLISIVKNERKITTRELSLTLNISKGVLYDSMKSIGIRKLCSRFIPRYLTREMQDSRSESCQNNLALYRQFGESFLKNIITMDETPLSLYIPQSKRESREWKFPGESGTRMLRAGTTHRKSLMLSVFWDWHGLILCDFAENGVKINSEYYSNLVTRCRQLRRKSKLSELYYLHDNAPIHTSGVSISNIEKLGLNLLSHPPYSPDLAPSDYYLFRHLKKELRGQNFDTKEELRTAVEEFLNGKPPIFFQKAFLELAERWKKCEEVNGSYIEK